jgi:hypothetical protein
MSKNRTSTESNVARVARLEAALAFAKGNLGMREQFRIQHDLNEARKALVNEVVS